MLCTMQPILKHMSCEKYHFEILYPYYMSDYFSMHFAALQNKINCLAATENATA